MKILIHESIAIVLCLITINFLAPTGAQEVALCVVCVCLNFYEFLTQSVNLQSLKVSLRSLLGLF